MKKLILFLLITNCLSVLAQKAPTQQKKIIIDTSDQVKIYPVEVFMLTDFSSTTYKTPSTFHLRNGNLNNFMLGIAYHFKKDFRAYLSYETQTLHPDNLGDQFGYEKGNFYVINQEIGAINIDNIHLGLGYNMRYSIFSLEPVFQIGLGVKYDANGNSFLLKEKGVNNTLEQYYVQKNARSYGISPVYKGMLKARINPTPGFGLFVYGSVSHQEATVEYVLKNNYLSQPETQSKTTEKINLSNYGFGVGIQVNLASLMNYEIINPKRYLWLPFGSR